MCPSAPIKERVGLPRALGLPLAPGRRPQRARFKRHGARALLRLEGASFGLVRTAHDEPLQSALELHESCMRVA